MNYDKELLHALPDKTIVIFYIEYIYILCTLYTCAVYTISYHIVYMQISRHDNIILFYYRSCIVYTWHHCGRVSCLEIFGTFSTLIVLTKKIYINIIHTFFLERDGWLIGGVIKLFFFFFGKIDPWMSKHGRSIKSYYSINCYYY